MSDPCRKAFEKLDLYLGDEPKDKLWEEGAAAIIWRAAWAACEAHMRVKIEKEIQQEFNSLDENFYRPVPKWPNRTEFRNHIMEYGTEKTLDWLKQRLFSEEK